MRVQPTPLHCTKCRHEWIGELIVDAPVEVAAASMRALHCPVCGADHKRVAFGRGDVPDPQPVQTGMTDPERRAAWLVLHDSGLSSCCIADVMCGMQPTRNHPHDGEDFGRCERLLMLYPEWRARLGEFDWVVVAVPATSDTNAMFGEAEFAAMKPGSSILNFARGSVIDQTALMAAVGSGQLGGAFLDVTDPEPLPSDHPLWKCENVHITQHLSGRSQTALFKRASERFLENLAHWHAGEPLIAQVDLDLGY